jgi:GT2 family glycosyltransferase
VETRAEAGSGERVAAVIVHHRTPEQTLRAARAAIASSPGIEVHVVDNASGDGLAEALAREAPGSHLHVEPVNLGFGGGCNRGVARTRRPFVLLLNSDAYLRPGAAAALAAVLEADPEAAAAGPRLLNADGSLQPSIQRLPSPWRVFCESSGLAFLAGGRGPFAGHTAVREDHGRARTVEALKGAALLVRRDAFEAAGGFDEGFFLYAEEADLMARWRKAGRRILFEPRAEVVHEGGASTGERYFGQLHASLVRYAAKHHGRAASVFVRAVLASGAALRYAVALVTPGESGRVRRARYRAALAGARR